MSKRKPQHVAVIGAGWAGCAAAVQLARAGIRVSLLEASRSLGGRARRVEVQGMELDNGQHILLGAYRACLNLLYTLHISEDQAFLRLPLQMVYAPHDDGMHFQAPSLPAPLHLALALLRAQGLARADKLALARFSSTARWMDWRMDSDCTVAELLQRFEQPPRLCRLMWNPLCIAALNTPPERASAQVFLNVLRDSLGARRSASDMLIPRLNLSALMPDSAAQFVSQHGGVVKLGYAVQSLTPNPDGSWQLAGAEPSLHADAVVLATDSVNARRLLSNLSEHAPVIPDYEFEPISTYYLQYPASMRLPRAMFALCDDVNQRAYAQFVFDRGHLDVRQAGLLAVVISAATPATELTSTELGHAIAQQLSQSFADPGLCQPLWSRVITEKRATFSCTPALPRPGNQTEYRNLFLAGDYTQSPYPATLEAAVQSGMSAAQALLD